MKITKITDPNCPICEEMSQFDTLVSRELGVGFEEMFLTQIPDHPKLLDYLLTNHVTHEGYIHLPFYLLEKVDGSLDYLVGEMDYQEFKEELKLKVFPD
jgi:hypothetical protein